MTKNPTLFLQPRIGPPESLDDAGWIGGHARLFSDFEYPVRDGTAYQFLLEINCSRFPAETWGGHMPNAGWIAVFVAVSGPLDVRLIYSREPEVEYRRPDAWSPEWSSFHHFAKQYQRFLGGPVAWPLSKIDGIKAPPSPTRQRPKDEHFRISSEANWPLDWETHILLVDEVVRSLNNRAQRYADTARQRAATLRTSPQRLLALLQEMQATAVELVEYFSRVSEIRKFTARRWLKRRADHIRLRLLSDEWALEENQGFHGVLGMARIEKANNVGPWPSTRVPSPLFPPSTRRGRVHSRILEKARNLEAELEAAPDVPKKDFKRMGPDYAAWADYRDRHPQEWLQFKARILDVRADFYDFWLDNQEAVNEALGGWDQFPLPSNWDKAIDAASQVVAWAETWLSKASSGISEADQSFLRERTETARRAADAANSLRIDLARANGEAADSDYTAANELELFKRIDGWSEAKILDDYWYVNFEVLRSEVGKRIYARNPDLLPTVARDRLERRWQFDAEQATIQLGGQPRGYCHSFAEAPGQTIMLFQIPSNHLTGLAFGDVNDLVISISEQNLRAQRFDLINCDVSN